MSRLVVVSNRVAVPKGVRPAPGGLAVGLLTALRESGGVWFGWNGEIVDRRPAVPDEFRRDGVEFSVLPLAKEDYEDYYRGFANRVLWPLIHGRLHLIDYRRRSFDGYRRVNAWLACHLIRFLRPDDVIWVHDYHLIPLASSLRSQGVSQPVGFFLHTPFPPYDMLRALPNYRTFLSWLTAYDLIGFQTDLDQRDFHESLATEFDVEPDEEGVFELQGRRFRTGVFPIGIDVDEVKSLARQGQAGGQGTRLRKRLDGRQLVLGVDRLDYSKGLVERFHAFGELLQRYPKHRRQVEFMQISQPSRADVPEYQEVRHRLDRVAGEIIGEHADYDWVPIHYISRSFTRTNVLGFMATAQVGFVTPLRDGMNLVAKEYVAAQDPENPGVLVLSLLAGAARELEAALLVNPYDVDGMADALARALEMPLAERRERWQASMQVLRHYDIHAWRHRFLDALTAETSDAYGNRAVLSG